MGFNITGKFVVFSLVAVLALFNIGTISSFVSNPILLIIGILVLVLFLK